MATWRLWVGGSTAGAVDRGCGIGPPVHGGPGLGTGHARGGAIVGLAVSSLHSAAGHGNASREWGRVASSASGPVRALVMAGGRPGRAVYTAGGTAAATELR